MDRILAKRYWPMAASGGFIYTEVRISAVAIEQKINTSPCFLWDQKERRIVKFYAAFPEAGFITERTVEHSRSNDTLIMIRWTAPQTSSMVLPIDACSPYAQGKPVRVL